jgi:nicotinate-nucleotide pyrophosphorylase (carboxylating)
MSLAGERGRPDVLKPPPRVVWQPLLELALREDLGTAGDLTTQATVDPRQQASVVVAARRAGVVAGLEVALETFLLVDPQVSILQLVRDGQQVAAGDRLAEISGAAPAILIAERTALNLLGRLCGIATATRDLVDRVEEAGAAARIVCTRKTTPGLRALEKYAVRCGGGANHRFGLGDAVLVKDNHIAFAGGIDAALQRVFQHVGHTVKVEVEVDTLEQLEIALRHPVDIVLLDNMGSEDLFTAVQLVREHHQRTGRQVLAEASGGITPGTVAAVAASGVDLISVGYLTHSAPALDVGLDWVG